MNLTEKPKLTEKQSAAALVKLRAQLAGIRGVAAQAATSMLVSIFVNIILPVLPGLILQSVPKIKTSKKALGVLEKTDGVLDGVLEEMREAQAGH